MKNLTEGIVTEMPQHWNSEKEETRANEMEMYLQTDGLNSNGKAIMCSIHHPTAELFEIFTHVILMYAGTIAFQGTLDEAQQFFLR